MRPRTTRSRREPAVRLLGLEAFVVLMVIGASLAITLFVHRSMTDLRESLPAQVLEQQQDISYIVHDLSNLLRAVETAQLDPARARDGSVLEKLHATQQRLQQIRLTYNFDNLVGASATHAVLNPALQDMERWLTDGLRRHDPTSAVVLELVAIRAREAHRRVRALFDQANGVAIDLIAAETVHIERFRDSLVAYLAVFGAFAIGVIVLFVRQREVQARLGLERKRLADSLGVISEGFALYDADDRLILCNQRFREIYPESSNTLEPGAHFNDIARHMVDTGVISGVDEQSENLFEERVDRHRSPRGPFALRLTDGRFIRVSEYRTREGGSIGIHTDITDLKRAQQRLEHLATHDPLTGLPNRTYYQNRLESAIAKAERHGTQAAVMFLDLDRFKLINDTLGHGGGDELLQRVAKTLATCLDARHTVARLGGDEFAFILEDVAGTEELRHYAERTLRALSGAFEVQDSEVFASASLGIAVYPRDGTDIPMLMCNADSACYHAKALGRNNYQFYTPELNAKAADRLLIHQHLRGALDAGEFTLHYQPQMNIADRRAVGMEALLRWHSRALGQIAPARFIPIAEDVGLITAIGEWVLREACAQNRRWRDRGLAPVTVSVNISARQFRQQDLCAVVRSALADTGLEPSALVLEITESAIMENTEATLETLRALSAMGVGLAVDDFGVGYSSLALLKRFPLHTLKIDSSFVRDITVDSGDLEIVSALIAMAHNLKLRVIAEGVETGEQLALLRERNCDDVQGYYVGPPCPATDAARFLRGGAREHGAPPSRAASG